MIRWFWLPSFFLLTSIASVLLDNLSSEATDSLILLLFEGKMDTDFEFVSQSGFLSLENTCVLSLETTLSSSWSILDNYSSSFLLKSSGLYTVVLWFHFLYSPVFVIYYEKNVSFSTFCLYIRTYVSYKFGGYLGVNRLWHCISKLITLTFSMKERFIKTKVCTSLCMLGLISIFGSSSLTFGHYIIEGPL